MFLRNIYKYSQKKISITHIFIILKNYDSHKLYQTHPKRLIANSHMWFLALRKCQVMDNFSFICLVYKFVRLKFTVMLG